MAAVGVDDLLPSRQLRLFIFEALDLHPAADHFLLERMPIGLRFRQRLTQPDRLRFRRRQLLRQPIQRCPGSPQLAAQLLDLTPRGQQVAGAGRAATLKPLGAPGDEAIRRDDRIAGACCGRGGLFERRGKPTAGEQAPHHRGARTRHRHELRQRAEGRVRGHGRGRLVALGR